MASPTPAPAPAAVSTPAAAVAQAAPGAEGPTPPVAPPPSSRCDGPRSGGAAADPELEAAKLAGETARHYGTMRFTMFTVFTTVAAALIAVPFTPGGSLFVHESEFQLKVLCTAGLATSLLFGLAEYRISYLVVFYQRAAYGRNALPEPCGHKVWGFVVGFIMLLPSLLTAAFWLLLLTGRIVAPEWLPPAE
jgi:hypothetical protein